MLYLLKRTMQPLFSERLWKKAVVAKTDFLSKKGYASFSQEGEDRVLSSLLFKLHGGRIANSGFYVDVGAHHPYLYSNTCLFYKRGWNGINIDAMPGSMTAFSRERPRDTNLECGIGEKADNLSFYVFNETALNTFDKSLATTRCNEGWQITATVDIPVFSLSEILEKHLPKGQGIDFLTVDVEGLDLSVLRSNDWQKYRPLVVLAETYGLSIEDLAKDSVTDYMRELGYTLYSRTINTSLFADNQALDNLIKSHEK